MHIVDMRRIVPLVTDGMLPKPPLPNSAFASVHLFCLREFRDSAATWKTQFLSPSNVQNNQYRPEEGSKRQ